MTKITCPFCHFSEEVPEEKIPDIVTYVKCPMCSDTFLYNFIKEKKASFFSRLLAAIIDMLFLNAIFLILSFIIDWGMTYLLQLMGITDEEFSFMLIGSTIYFTCVLILFSYFTYFTHRYGITLGKKVLGIKVVNEMGTNPDLLQTIKREVLGKILSSIFFGAGFLWAIIDENNQALHDKIAKTYVISI